MQVQSSPEGILQSNKMIELIRLKRKVGFRQKCNFQWTVTLKDLSRCRCCPQTPGGGGATAATVFSGTLSPSFQTLLKIIFRIVLSWDFTSFKKKGLAIFDHCGPSFLATSTSKRLDETTLKSCLRLPLRSNFDNFLQLQNLTPLLVFGRIKNVQLAPLPVHNGTIIGFSQRVS